MALAEGPDYATRAMFRMAAVADEAEAREAGYHRPSLVGNNLRSVGKNVTV